MPYAVVCARIRTQTFEESEISVMDGRCLLVEVPPGGPGALADLLAGFCKQTFFPEACAAFGAAGGEPSCRIQNAAAPDGQGLVRWKIEIKACAVAPSLVQAEAAACQLPAAALQACAAELARLGIACLPVCIPPAYLLDERCHAEAEKHAGHLLAESEKCELQKCPHPRGPCAPRAKF